MKKVVYRDRYLKIVREIETVRGKKIERFTGVRPDFVVVIPRLSNGKLLLERQYRFALKKYLYEFPAGVVDHSENPTETVRRELEEETGYRPKKVARLFRGYWSPSGMAYRAHFYYAGGLEAVGKKHFDDTEIITTLEVSEKQLERMITRGEIEDAKTILAFLYYKRYMNRS